MSNNEMTTGGTNAAAATLASMTVESLRDLLQDAGYRVETIGEGRARFLRSASNRFAFDIRPGSAIPGTTDRFADVAFVALLAVQGTLPLELINRWNCTRRFGRLFLDQTIPGQDFLVLSMDSSFAGGVSAQQMRVQVEIWDSLLQQFVPWLREELSKVAPKIDAVAAPASAENTTPSAEAPVPAGAAA